MFRRRLLGFGYATASLVVMALVSGCTNPVPVEGEDKLASEAAKLDFVYDATIDQIAHMSCSAMPITKPNVAYDRSAYFTFRVGAYRNAGLQLSDSFYASVGKKPIEKQAEILALSEKNTNTILQVALRGRSNYQTLFTSNGEATVNFDYANMLAPLGTAEMSQTLVNLPEGERIKYVRNGQPGGYRFEGSLLFTTDFGLVQSTRNFLADQGLLAVTYSLDGSDDTTASMARSPGDVEGSKTDTGRSVYGRGYQIGFSKPLVSSLHAQYPQNVLSSVSEVNLDSASNRTGLGTWTCPSDLQFRIVRAEDIARNLNCKKVPDPATLNLSNPKHVFLQYARNSLKAEDWWIDMDGKCIIPKKSGLSCYGSYQNVQYSMGDACNNNSDGICVAYASICYRN